MEHPKKKQSRPTPHPILASAASLTAASAASLWLALGDHGTAIKNDTLARVSQATGENSNLGGDDRTTIDSGHKKTKSTKVVEQRSLRDRVRDGDQKACEELFQKYFQFNKDNLNINASEYENKEEKFLDSVDLTKEELKATINGYTIKKWFDDIENEEMSEEAKKEFPNIEDPSKREAAYLDKRYRFIMSVLDTQSQDPFNETFIFQTGMTKEALQDRVRETFVYTIQHSGINSGSEADRYERIEKAYEVSIRKDSLLSSDPY